MHMKPGDLIEWFDYTIGKRYVGLYLRKRSYKNTVTWADIVVLCKGKEVEWVSWQCRVIDEGG